MNKTIISLICLVFGYCPGYVHGQQSTDAETFSQAELEQMLAPIALYPDSVLTHILIASTYPLEVVQAERWVSGHPDLEPNEALQAVDKEDWDPSVKALVPFPKLLARLSNNLSWTQQLGDAFLQDEAQVLASIQSLRHQADQAGNLDEMRHMNITHEADNIVIQPVETKVIYVPYYDSQVVYGNWRWRNYPPVSWRHHHHDHHAIENRLFYWPTSVYISQGFFFNAFNWRHHHIVALDHHLSTYNYRRHHILDHRSAKRWHHSPVHRRGVAYHSEPLRHRFHSNRPSTHHSRDIRRHERNIISSGHSSSARKKAVKIRVNSSATTHITRQERLKKQLDRATDIQQAKAAHTSTQVSVETQRGAKEQIKPTAKGKPSKFKQRQATKPKKNPTNEASKQQHKRRSFKL